MRELFTFGRYLRGKYDQKIYKIPVSIPGFTCPNIDGSVAVGGCSFCENESFSPNLTVKPKSKFSLKPNSAENPMLEFQLLSLESQFFKTSVKLQKKFKAKSFLVYFQSFSNTYAPYETLEALYQKALSLPNVTGLSIGTRSDCIDDRVLEFLAEQSKEQEIWIEIGVQSVFDETLAKINRGHDFNNIEEAIARVKSYGLNLCLHLIFGLPGENVEMMRETFEKSIQMGADSVKFHPLYVVKNTALANEFRAGKFTPIDEEGYISLLCECIEKLPQNVSVQRVTAGIDDDTLLSPMWCKHKNIQMEKIKMRLKTMGILY